MKNPKSKVKIWIWDFGNKLFNLCSANNNHLVNSQKRLIENI